ncbi:site-specific integrase [Phormidium sp. LEGE 05292]|uniref:tyrosine-type recombinase/integrase n=1 Tax=[Phormidium] sp. LEGE 05292 TaxID=767427 RepID=UPI0018818C90|nr:site-specific integrase [Phormidium sp. LEGE 05292]MBE9229235.1 site-specific integrase [Phormidium sp. LEGE 05292]
MTDLDLTVSSLILATPTPLTRQPAAVYLSSLTAGSRRTMGKALNAIARLLTDDQCDALTLNWAALRYQHTAAIRAVLMEKYAPATANRMLCALRRVLKEARRLGLMSADDYAAAVDLPSVRGESPSRGRALKNSEIAALLKVCRDDPSLLGARDAALLAILSGTGLRRSEVVALDVADFDPATGSLQVRHGKGKKSRTVYLPDGASRLVFSWLELRGSTPGALINPIRRGDRIEMRQMTDQAVMVILQKRGVQAKVANFSPHDFRRTFISNLLEAGADVLTVSRLAGHADPATTSKYDKREEVAKRKAVQLLQIPFD